MKEFSAIVKNADKFNERIKLAKGLILSLNKKKEREGVTGKSTEYYGSYWFKSPKGDVIFKYTKPRQFNDTTIIQDFNEILCYNLARQMGINCAEYSSATLENELNGIASKNFLKKDEKIVPLVSITPSLKNLESIMVNLKQKDFLYNSINYDQIYYSLYSYMVFDLLTYQEDRHLNNISLIKDKNNNLKIAPLYDNEYSFFASTFLFSGADNFDNVKDYVDNYFITGGLVTPFDMDKCYGLNGFDIVSHQILYMAKNDKKCDYILKNLLKNADLRPVYDELEKQGYNIDQDYKEYTIQLLDFSRKRLCELYKTNNKPKIEEAVK